MRDLLARFLSRVGVWRMLAMLSTVAATACASLPDVHDLRERQRVPDREPSIVSTRGELPDMHKQSLLERLEDKAGPTDILAKHIAAEEAISGRPLVAGNKEVLLDDGPATMRAMMAAIETARHHVNLETYIFEADEVGHALADLLIRKKAGGVNISKVYGKSSFLQSKRRSPPPKDAKETAWRDTHMQLEGPVVAEFQKLFLDTWQRKTGQALPDTHFFPALKPASTALVRAIGSTPDNADFAIYKTYVSAFTHADKVIHLTTAYFVPDRQVLQAMTDAARRGVDVRIIFPSFSDVGLMLHAGRSYYAELLAAGIKVYERKKRKSAMLHAKTAVIDGVWSTIGSTNLDMRSFLHNDEVNAVVLSTEFAERMDTLFQRDLRESVEITAEQWRKRGLRDRLREWAVRMFEYWL